MRTEVNNPGPDGPSINYSEQILDFYNLRLFGFRRLDQKTSIENDSTSLHYSLHLNTHRQAFKYMQASVGQVLNTIYAIRQNAIKSEETLKRVQDRPKPSVSEQRRHGAAEITRKREIFPRHINPSNREKGKSHADQG